MARFVLAVGCLVWPSLVATVDVATPLCPARHGASFQTRDTTICSPMTGLHPLPGHQPWTHEPNCRKPSAGKKGDTRKFCLYTRSPPNSKRGIAFITIPEAGEEIAANSNFKLYDDWTELRSESGKIAPYEAREMPGRGIGLFANQEIAAGDVIISDLPVLMIARQAIAALRPNIRHTLQWRGFLRLPVETRRLYRNLAKSKGGDEIDDVLQTNSIGVVYGSDHAHLAVFPEAARINHACVPNAYYRFNETTMSLQVFALRTINPDEEITFAYTHAEGSHEERQEHFKTHWGFECTCSLCAASEKERLESDKRLWKIGRTKQQISAAPKDQATLLDLVQNILGLYDEQGLIAPKARYYEIAAYSSNQLGQDTQATNYANMARQHYSILAGPGSWEVKRMDEFLRNPKAHPSWNLATKATT